MLNSVILSLIFKVKHFLVKNCCKKRTNSADVLDRFASNGRDPAVELLWLHELLISLHGSRPVY